MSDSLRIIFAGTPDFAVPTLRTLCGSRHRLCAVYTQPDRPAGRGRKLTPSAVKETALEYGCDVRQPKTLRDSSVLSGLAQLNPDVMVVAAYGLILPPEVIDLPRYGCLNIHASLLPRWRGAAPIQRAILAGDQETGITIMQMDAGLDTGAMLSRVAVTIEPADTSETLRQTLSQKGAELLLEVLPALQQGPLRGQAQDAAQACYADKLRKSEANLDWTRSAVELDRQVRGMLPWPVAESAIDGRRLRVWSSTVIGQTTSAQAGTIINAGKQGIDVATGDGVLRLLQVQSPGGKSLAAAEFANAHSLTGVRLGVWGVGDDKQ